MSAVAAEIARPTTPEALEKWYAKHGITPDSEGWIDDLPYGPSPVEKDEIVEHVRVNAARHEVRNLTGHKYIAETFVFVCGGPSVADHLDEIKQKSLDPNYHVYTSNATCRYLLSKGIVPMFQVIIDPKPSKVHDLKYDAPAGKPTLLLGLQCHPDLFDAAAKTGRPTFKFLAASATDRTPSDIEVARAALTEQDPELIGIGGGSMMGTRALFLAESLGYRKVEFYGLDGSITVKDGNVVNYYSYNKPRGESVLECVMADGRKFNSTMAFARQSHEIVALLDKLPGMDMLFHGEGMIQHQVGLWAQANPHYRIRITPEYAAQMAQMHDVKKTFGRSGHAHAARVFVGAAQLLKRNGSCRVLDYGCGKETLKYALEQSFPDIGMEVVGYDPGIPGLDQEPEKADMVVCGDVMEHVERPCVSAVIDHIAELTKHVAIFVVSLVPAQKVLPDGRNAHITLEHPDWWRSHLKRRFVIVEDYNAGHEVTFVGIPIERWQSINEPEDK